MPGAEPVERRYPRIHTALPLLARALGNADDYEEMTLVRTLGLGGCMFHSPRPLGYRTLVQLLISVGARIVRTEGRVVWERTHGDGGVQVGVEFLRVAAEDRAALRTLFPHVLN